MTLRFSSLDALANFAKIRARIGTYNGTMSARNQRYVDACMHHYTIRPDLGASVLFTRDTGHHTGGWWKNPDYERCLHLSLSFVALPPAAPIPFEKAEGERIALAFYGDAVRRCWVEPPYSPEGKARDVWHYRVFCDVNWRPFKPRGEVYDTENTPSDWKSFSEIHGWSPKRENAPYLVDHADAGDG